MVLLKQETKQCQIALLFISNNLPYPDSGTVGKTVGDLSTRMGTQRAGRRPSLLHDVILITERLTDFTEEIKKNGSYMQRSTSESIYTAKREN